MTDTTADLSAQLGLIRRQNRVRFRILVSIICLIFLLLASVAAFNLWQIQSIKKSQKDLEFSQAITDYDAGTDFVTADIGSIQFLRRGFSISFDSANYSQDGLDLTGTIGNPTQLAISSLSLHFSVRPYPYSVRDKWEKEGFLFYNPSEFEIGNGQVNVGYLGPGSTAAFSVTVPNVKQTKESQQIAVWFSGERYTYLK
jgi:hypothetical protein